MSQIKPVLRRLHSPDVIDLEAYSPSDPSCFSFLLQAMFGPDDGEGEESFDIIVCTPGWIAGEVARKRIMDGRHHLIVDVFDLQKIQSFLTTYANSCSARTWQEAATKLSRVGKWEFEDYKP
jgi:hypothetical protein